MASRAQRLENTAKRGSLGREGLRSEAKRVQRLASEMKADSPKGYQAVRDAASSGAAMKSRNLAKAQKAAEGFVERQRPMGRIGTLAESASRKVGSIAKGVAKGLLSPAGAGEAAALDVAARTFKSQEFKDMMDERAAKRAEKKDPGYARVVRRNKGKGRETA